MHIGKDLKEVLTVDYLGAMAENHVDGWKDRYMSKQLGKIKLDLSLNHDSSLEIERVEADLRRELNERERDYLVNKFNSAIIDYIKFIGLK